MVWTVESYTVLSISELLENVEQTFVLLKVLVCVTGMP